MCSSTQNATEEVNTNIKKSASFENFSRICRFCLGFEDIKPIGETTYKEVSIRIIIHNCLSLKVDIQDNLPQHLCTNCLDEFIKYHEFKERCIEVEKILADIYKLEKEYIGNVRKSIECIEVFSSDNGVLPICKSIHYNNKNDAVESTKSEIKLPAIPIECKQELLNSNKENHCTKEDENQKFLSDFLDSNNDEIDDGNYSDVSISSAEYQIQKVTVANKQRFECKKCAQIYNTKKELNDHQKNVKHPQIKDVCSVCNKTFAKNRLRAHIRSHEEDKSCVCRICSRVVSSKRCLEIHMLTHSGVRPHTCATCGRGFFLKTKLNAHTKFHQGRCTTQAMTCEICGRDFKMFAYYRAHLEKHLADGETQVTEMIPEASSTTSKEFVCSTCNRSYKNKYSLKVHQMLHDDKSVLCNKCGKIYKNQNSLKVHQIRHGEKNFLCNECGKAFISNSSLQAHMKVHTGFRPFKCTVCNKKFSQSGQLSKHMLVHTGRKPYKCEVCGKAFTQYPHWQNHMRTHSGEKPFSCNYCGKKFSLKCTLTVHTRTHTGETPYLCPECGKGFYDSSSMKKHRKRHENIVNGEETQNT